MATQITMNTSTDVYCALSLPFDLFVDFYNSLVRISEEMYEENKKSKEKNNV